MDDTVSSKALDSIELLKWMYENGYFSLIAADMIADELEKGTFDLVESEGEPSVESQKKEIELLKQSNMDVEHNRKLLSDELTSQKAITELAVKGLKEIREASFSSRSTLDRMLEMDRVARSTSSEIERLHNAPSEKYITLRPEVQWFAEQMELALRDNEHKGGWRGTDDEYFIEAIYHNASCIKTSGENKIRRTANVANHAMMIADNSRRDKLMSFDDWNQSMVAEDAEFKHLSLEWRQGIYRNYVHFHKEGEHRE